MFDGHEGIVDRYKRDIKVESRKRAREYVKPKEFKRCKVIGMRGGGSAWDKFAVQMVCELLVPGVSPNAIPGTILTMYETLYDIDPGEVPGATFAREFRDVIRIVCETLSAMKLATSEDWKQIFTDATTRLQQLFST